MRKITLLFLLMTSSIINSQTFTENIVDGNILNATSTFIIDLDSDGDKDLLAVSYSPGTALVWYENNGSQSFTKHIIDNTLVGGLYVISGDFDGDADNDIAVNDYNDNKVLLFINDGSENFTKQIVDSTATGSNYTTSGDFDGDGNIDLATANYGGNELAWYESNGASPTLGFTKHVIDASFSMASSIESNDLDGDGDVDLIATSIGGNELAWYQNDGTGVFTKQSITTTFMGAITAYGEDMDGDGDIDILAAASVGNEVAWFENNGASLTPTFTKHTIDATTNYASFAQAADFNNDGYLDVVASATTANQLVWFESNGASPPVFTKHIIPSTVNAPAGIYTGDIDGDGDEDIAVTSSGNTDELLWFDNDTITASLDNLQTVGFNYYPNPASNELTMTANENITSISIYNMLGQEVKTSNPSALETKIDMSKLANGTYFVKAQVGDAIGTFKVIKK